jgi:EmrB/QacA subfamily drug resistance transporter
MLRRMNENPLPRWRVFPALALGTVMATLDISVVNLALPTIARDLHAPLTTITWVVLAYVLLITGLLLSFGRMADRIGRRSMYRTGLVLFVVSSALCATARSAPWLIAARALQGLGAAMMSSNSTALLVAAFPSTERGRALGAFGAAVGVGLAFGPPLGGWIVAALSWRWIFLINLPLGGLAMWMLLTRVPKDVPAREGEPIDLGAALLWSLGLGLLMLPLSLGPERGWADRYVTGSALGALVVLGLFGWTERRSRDPLLPWTLIGGPLGPAATLTLIGQILSIGVAFLLPLYLQDVAGYDPGRAGRWLALLPVVSLICAPLAGRWADRFGGRPLITGGLLVAAAGDVVMSGMGVGAHGYVAGAILLGVGLGFFTVPNASAVMGAVPTSQLGTASGLQGTMRNLGIASGTAAAAATTATLYARVAHSPLLGMDAAHTDHQALAWAVHGTFLGLAGLAGVGAALAAFAPALPRPAAEPTGT